MKIYIQDKRKVVIALPNACLKVIGWGICKDLDKEDKKATQRLMKDSYQVLKRYKKENGPFTLVDVEEKDGAKVKIIV